MQREILPFVAAEIIFSPPLYFITIILFTDRRYRRLIVTCEWASEWVSDSWLQF